MILYIDTSSSFLYTGIVKEGILICQIQKEFGHHLSEVALPEIASMFKQNEISPKDISKIIVVNGPGSFTGIRIGITIAKVYAWSLNIPITTISSLEAMAVSSKSNKNRVPVLDARRDYCFGAIYDNNYQEIIKPKYMKYEELKIELEKIENYDIISNDEIKISKEAKSYQPDILKIVTRFKEKDSINPHAVNPEYLKLTEAEEKNCNDS